MFKIKIKDQTIKYNYTFRNVKYIRYELEGDFLKIILPHSCEGNVEEYILKKENWIYKKVVEYKYPSSELYGSNYNNNYKIKDKTLKFAVKYKKIKYIRYKLFEDRLLILLPNNYKNTVEHAIKLKEKWLYKKLITHENYAKKLDKQTSNIKLNNRTFAQLKQLCNYYINIYSKKLNVKVNRLQYRDMTRKWGSCSSKSNITLSKSLQYLPDKLVSYIVYHELCHLIVMAHNKAFFDIIKQEFPDYEECDKQLEEYNYL